jgi:hypothetical protein
MEETNLLALQHHIVQNMNNMLEGEGRPATNHRQRQYLTWYITADRKEWKKITYFSQYMAEHMLRWLEVDDTHILRCLDEED